jgi:hypothetical protein
MNSVNFEYADLGNVRLSFCVAEGNMFHNCRFSGCKIDHTNLIGSTFSGLNGGLYMSELSTVFGSWLTILQSRLDRSEFHNCELPFSSIARSSVRDVVFYKSKISGDPLVQTQLDLTWGDSGTEVGGGLTRPANGQWLLPGSDDLALQTWNRRVQALNGRGQKADPEGAGAKLIARKLSPNAH